MSKYQLSIWAIILALFILPGMTHAAYDDVSLTTDTVITVGSINLNVSGSSATIDSIVVYPTYFTAVLSATSSIKVTNSNGYSLTTSANPAYVTKTCSSGLSSLTLAIPGYSGNSGISMDVTPTTDPCTSSGSSNAGGSVSSGGGAAIPYYRPSVSPIITVPVKAGITGVSPIFTKRIVQGASSDDVRRLQTLLASDPSVYPEGQVTGYFGKLTRKAVENFQIKYGIAKPGTEGFGTVGPMTRASLQKVFGK